ncbi:MAG: galactokinase family protein [Chloroflexota bacterium]
MSKATSQAGTLLAPPGALLAAYERLCPGVPPQVIARAPGRVNLLGGHVDMHGGTVITIAIDRGVWLVAAPASGAVSTLHAADLGETVALAHAADRLAARMDAAGDPLPRWAQYPAGVIWALGQRRLEARGMNAAFSGDLPMGAGLSSSAAVEVAFAIGWAALGGWQLAPGALAEVGLDAERGYLGLGIGIQDQYTVLHARAGHALWLDCRSLEHRHIALPLGAAVVVCDTATRRALVGSGYGGRAQDAHDAARIIRQRDPAVHTLRDVTLAQLEAHRSALSDGQYRRARHVVSEIARVAHAVEVLARGDLIAFGALMSESYCSARDDYGSSSPALDAMWAAATAQPGCWGARYSGGGEAGAVVALVEASAVGDFLGGAAAAYQRVTGREGAFFPVEAVTAAGVWNSQ